MRAGERALGRSANYEAVDHFQNALAIAEHLPEGPGRQKEVLEATLKLGEALSAAGRLSDSLAKYKLAAQLAREAGDTKAFIRSALGFDGAQFLSAKPLERIAPAAHGSDGQSRSRRSEVAVPASQPPCPSIFLPRRQQEQREMPRRRCQSGSTAWRQDLAFRLWRSCLSSPPRQSSPSRRQRSDCSRG